MRVECFLVSGVAYVLLSVALVSSCCCSRYGYANVRVNAPRGRVSVP